MEACAKFDREHKPPGDEADLAVYCQALGLVLAQLSKVKASYVGAVRNFMLSVASCVLLFVLRPLCANCADQLAHS